MNRTTAGREQSVRREGLYTSAHYIGQIEIIRFQEDPPSGKIFEAWLFRSSNCFFASSFPSL